MKILIFGKTGRLGSALAARLVQEGHEVRALSRNDCAVGNPYRVTQMITEELPDVVINATAKNGLEQCHERVDQAIEVNTFAPAVMARACETLGILRIHFSTDYVFSGDEMGLFEDTPTNPCGAYGYTKLWGEQAVQMGCPWHYVFRLSSLYGTDLAGMLGPIRQVQDGHGLTEDDPVKVLDQYCAPTLTRFVAEVVAQLLRRDHKLPDTKFGLYHLATMEGVWKLDFTAEMLREVFGRDYNVATGTLAVPRPRMTQLVGTALHRHFPELIALNWRDDLQHILPFVRHTGTT